MVRGQESPTRVHCHRWIAVARETRRERAAFAFGAPAIVFELQHDLTGETIVELCATSTSSIVIPAARNAVSRAVRTASVV